MDVQNDFCPGGKLPVSNGDSIVSLLNKYAIIFSNKKLPIFASRDWHPKKTKHFKKFGGLWPEHCIQNTKGAQFNPKLKLPPETIIISKGMQPQQESYSAFQAVDSSGTEFVILLKFLGINEIFLAGLATDYCVKWSVLDALKSGLKTYLLLDAVKGVNIKPNDSEEAIKEMIAQGASIITFEKVAKYL